MVQVNLLSKRKGVKKKRNIFNIVAISVFAIFALYFLFEASSVVYRLISVNQKMAQVKKNTQTVSSEILKDNVKLNQFILTKYILEEIITLRTRQFDFVGFLDQISAILPTGTDLSGVDFSSRDFVNVKTSSTNADSFGRFESLLRSTDLASTNFSSIVIKDVSRTVDGSYTTNMLFGIKSNGPTK